MAQATPKRPSKKRARQFSGMGYREVQRANSQRRGLLPKAQQAWLKDQGYRNTGWDAVTVLYQKLNELTLQPDPTEDTLEDLFLKADRIGSKYQTAEEVHAFQAQLAAETAKVANTVDRQFPESETDFVDYGAAARRRRR